MVSKKQTKITVEVIAKRSVICVRPTMLQEKNWKRKKKISRPKKVQSVKKAARARLKKDVRAITGQHCNVNIRNNTNDVFSIFNKINFEPKWLQAWKTTPNQSAKCNSRKKP